MKIESFYEERGRPAVRHDDLDCPYGQQIPIGLRRVASGNGRRLCLWCATHRDVPSDSAAGSAWERELVGGRVLDPRA